MCGGPQRTGRSAQAHRAYLAGYDAPIPPMICYTGSPHILQRLKDELEIAPDSDMSLWQIWPNPLVCGELLPHFNAKLLTSF